jgi:hypothetical protein
MSNFDQLPLNAIRVENRQRSELKGVEELAESIRQYGLINPILIDRENRLIAGEHRLEAYRLLGYDSIPVHYSDTQDAVELAVLELEENVRRTELSWKDQTKAVTEYHKAQVARNPDWSREKTGAALQINSTKIFGIFIVQRMIDDGVPEVIEAPKFSTAVNFASRRQERQKTAFLHAVNAPTPVPVGDVAGTPSTAPTAPISPKIAPRATIETVNFNNWAKSVQPVPFNLIHCDFPYGVSAGDTVGQSAAKTHGGYTDTAAVYFELLKTLCTLGPNFIAPSAHMIFWFSMDYYQETIDLLHGADWRVDPFPLIWHKTDNTGILPDPNRGPRRTYETALFCTMGDRKIVRAVANSTGTGTTKLYHMSEKAEIMLTHFMRMLVDETTRMLDPTCGSGMAVRVAESAGADFSLGLEANKDFAEGAMLNLERDR